LPHRIEEEEKKAIEELKKSKENSKTEKSE